MKKLLENLLKLGISVFLLWLVLHNVDLHKLWGYIRSINIPLYIPAILIAMTAFILSAIRWYVFIRAYGLNISIWEAIKFVMIALSVGIILPAGAGPDVVRFLYGQKKNRHMRAQLLSSIFMDRFIGLTSLIFLALVGIYMDIKGLEALRKVIWVVLAGFIITLLFLLSETFDRITLKIFGNIQAFRLGERIEKFVKTFSMYRENKPALLLCFLISLTMQSLFGLSVYFIALSMGFHLDPVKAIFITASVNFITMIPISFSGIGIREGAFVFLIGQEIGREAAIALSLIYYFTTILAFSPGIIFFLMEPIRDRQ